MYKRQADRLFEIVEDAFLKASKGEVLFPDKISQIFDTQTQNRINCMPATLLGNKVAGLKWVSVFVSVCQKSEIFYQEKEQMCIRDSCITTHLVPLSTGIDMVKATIDISLGLYPDIEPKFEQGSAIRYFQVCPGKIYSIEGINAARKIAGICDIICTCLLYTSKNDDSSGSVPESEITAAAFI